MNEATTMYALDQEPPISEGDEHETAEKGYDSGEEVATLGNANKDNFGSRDNVEENVSSSNTVQEESVVDDEAADLGGPGTTRAGAEENQNESDTGANDSTNECLDRCTIL